MGMVKPDDYSSTPKDKLNCLDLLKRKMTILISRVSCRFVLERTLPKMSACKIQTGKKIEIGKNKLLE